jgi:hypothetical protein
MSMLEYQASLDRKNAENILKVKEIPCNNQITRLVDGINPGEFDENFKDGLGLAEKRRFDSAGRRIILRKKCGADTVCT